MKCESSGNIFYLCVGITENVWRKCKDWQQARIQTFQGIRVVVKGSLEDYKMGFIYLGKNEGERSTSNNEEQENHLCYLRPHSIEIKYNKFLLQQEGVEEDIELDGLRFNY